MILTICFALIKDISFVANLANLGLLLAFSAVNLSNIVLRYKLDDERGFRCPINVGKFPVISLMGLVTSLALLCIVVLNLL